MHENSPLSSTANRDYSILAAEAASLGYDAVADR